MDNLWLSYPLNDFRFCIPSDQYRRGCVRTQTITCDYVFVIIIIIMLIYSHYILSERSSFIPQFTDIHIYWECSNVNPFHKIAINNSIISNYRKYLMKTMICLITRAAPMETWLWLKLTHGKKLISQRKNGKHLSVSGESLRNYLRDQQYYIYHLFYSDFVVAFVILAANMILATVSLSLVHERLPDRNVYKPLPDIFLDNILPQAWALDVSEILIMIQVNCCILLILFHKHRYVHKVARNQVLQINIHCHSHENR